MAVKAMSKAVGYSPKKLQPLIRSVRGMRVQEALDALRFMTSPAAALVAKVVHSAAANAENNLMLNPSRLRVVAAYADQGPVLKRYRARARGRPGPLIRRTSHITVLVDEEGA